MNPFCQCCDCNSLQLNAFEKEIIVYQDLIPVWKDHLNLAMLRPLKIAKCFNIDKSNSLILLENLAEEEFHVTSMKSESKSGLNTNTIFEAYFVIRHEG